MNADTVRPSQLKMAVNDLVEGLRRKDLWLTLAWDDLLIRYKRSVLGPIWITLGTGFFIAVISYLWSDIMNREVDVFVPWLASGLTLWQLLTASVTEGTSTFIRGAGIIQNISMPLSIHVYQIVMRHVLNYMHNFLVVIFVLILFPPSFGLAQLLFIPGLFIIIMAAVAASLLLGIIGVRFRDFSHTVSMLMAPMFFLTPIIWMPDMLSGIRATIANLNPFTHFVAVVREPLLGRVPELLNYAVTLGILLLLISIALYMLGRYRVKVPYWL